MDRPNPSDEWTRIAGTTQVLLRSRIEIARILQSIAASDVPLVAFHENPDRLFIAKLHSVSSEENHVLVGYSDSKPANAEILTARATVFGASYRAGHVEFSASHPCEIFDPVERIRFDFPDVLFIHQRRVHKRIPVIPKAKLYCVADRGGITPFEASIVDISLSGMGAMLYDDSIILEPGTVLWDCMIALPDRTVATVDIQIKYLKDIVHLEGKAVRRAGCRFLGLPDQIEKLIRVFVLNLESVENQNDR